MAECRYEGCSGQAWDDCPQGFCICHSPDNGKDEAIAKKVWDDARERAGNSQGCSYRGWHFPKDPKEQWFNELTFQTVAVFYGATFEDYTYFNGATFKETVNFLKTTFESNAFFQKTVFAGDVHFGSADFQDCVVFSEVIFRGDAWFQEATFSSIANFNKATFHRLTGFEAIPIREKTNIVLDLPSPELPFYDATPFRKREYGQWLYRLAKECARRRGDYRMAGDYHFAEQCAIEYGRRRTTRCRLWHYLAEWGFARTIFGYGERVKRPLIAGLVVIALWAVIYSATGGVSLGEATIQTDAPIRFWECLYFSLITFTTLGYGDMVPSPHLFFRFLAGVEAWLGAGLMAVFIVALTRKYIR